MAKPLANGYPVGAVLIRDTVAKYMTAGVYTPIYGSLLPRTKALNELQAPTELLLAVRPWRVLLDTMFCQDCPNKHS